MPPRSKTLSSQFDRRWLRSGCPFEEVRIVCEGGRALGWASVLARGDLLSDGRLQHYHDGAPVQVCPASFVMRKEKIDEFDAGPSQNSLSTNIWTSAATPIFDAQLGDSGVSSVDAVAFFKEVNQTFSLALEAEDCLQFKTLRDLVAYIDARAA